MFIVFYRNGLGDREHAKFDKFNLAMSFIKKLKDHGGPAAETFELMLEHFDSHGIVTQRDVLFTALRSRDSRGQIVDPVSGELQLHCNAEYVKYKKIPG